MWALFPWFEEHGESHVHPEDLGELLSLMPYGKVFEVQGKRDGHTVLAYGDLLFRVQPSLLREVDQPAFRIGEEVRVKEGGMVAKVSAILWHHSKAQPFYHLALKGKKKKKRYWAGELVPAAASESSSACSPS